jgi:hypothetical protein
VKSAAASPFGVEGLKGAINIGGKCRFAHYLPRRNGDNRQQQRRDQLNQRMADAIHKEQHQGRNARQIESHPYTCSIIGQLS